MVKRKGMTTPQKLLVTVLFLGAVALAVGGEDRPGLLTIAQKSVAKDTPEQMGDASLGPAVGAGARQNPQHDTDEDAGSLDDWYAEVTPIGPGAEVIPISGSDNGGNNTGGSESPGRSDEPKLSAADEKRLQAQIRN